MGLRFDIIGDIAIAEVPEGAKARDVAKIIMESNRRVRTVYKKSSAREGIFRTRKLRLIGGENNPITIHKENGILLKMDVKKCYFSPREGTERMRIMEKIKSFTRNSGKTAMVFFSGIGAFPILISRRTGIGECFGIELNPDAVKYFRENIALNKAINVIPVSGDVSKEARKFHGKCDFVIMPLPETGWKFLSYAIRCLKPEGICFFYAISDEKDLYGKWKKKIASSAKKLRRKVKVLETRKVLPYASRKWKVRLDFSVRS